MRRSELLHAALSALEVPVRLVRYPGEGHSIYGPEAQEDAWARMLAWLHEWLGPPARRPGALVLSGG